MLLIALDTAIAIASALVAVLAGVHFAVDARRTDLLLSVGFGVAALSMLAFEIAFGRLVFRASWQRLAADFDFRKGGLLSIGMAVLLVAPLLTAKLRGLV